MKLPKSIKRGKTYRITLTFNKQRYSCTRATKLLELKSGKAEIEKGIKPHF